MPPAPPTLPAPRRGSALARALQVLSPSSLFHAKQPPPPQLASASAKPAMPAHAMDALLQLVDFLEEHHRRVEGLYRKPAPREHETEEILRALRGPGYAPLPDLAKFSPHALAAAIKEVLAEDFAPLIPYDVSQSLLERTASQDEAATLRAIIATVKELAPATRELLKVLLIHLHHIATSVPSRMSSKDLASQVGVLLVRPTEETDDAATKTVLKQRRSLARLLIENANALPYNERDRLTSRSVGCETDSPIKMAESAVRIPQAAQEDRSSPRKHLHYVQAMWDTQTHTHTEETLQHLLASFGEIATLAINESSNRAIVAFTTDGGAQAAAEASITGVRIRRRKQRTPASASPSTLSQITDKDFTTPIPSPAKDSESLQPPNNSSKTPDTGSPLAEVHNRNTADVISADRVTELNQTDRGEKTQVTEESSVGSPMFLHKLERPPSMFLVQKAMINEDEMTLEDMESPPTSPEATQDEKDAAERRSLSRINEVTEDEDRAADKSSEHAEVVITQEVATDSAASRGLQRRRSLKEFLTVVTGVTAKPMKEVVKQTETNAERRKDGSRLFSPSSHTKIGLIADLKLMISRKRTPRSVCELWSADSVDSTVQPDASVSEGKPGEQPAVVYAQIETRSIKTQTKMAIHPVHHEATSTDDLPRDEATGDSSRIELENAQAQAEKLAMCLSEVQSELLNLASALSAMRLSDTDRAILQAHAKLCKLIARTLYPNSIEHNENDQHGHHGQYLDGSGSATSEFVAFIETRATTQVKILEAEVRAGQELLRLHRSQHQKEVTELEAEVTRLIVVQRETEKMCSELRGDLRKCRAELTCHVATAASIQRDRRDAEERLVICENKLRGKEQELLQLQLAHAEMREIAGGAQRRLEEYRGGKQHLPIQSKENTDPHKPSYSNQLSTGVQFPKAAAFLKEHCSGNYQDNKASPSSSTLSSVVPVGPFVNTVELASMKKRLEESIHAQVESTKISLRELQAFGDNQQLDEDVDLELLQQRLGSARDELDSAMDASRQKLRELLHPVRDMQDDDDLTSFDPTALVENLLANALAADSRETNQRSAVQFQPVEPMMPSWTGRSSDIQSEMFKKWMHGRAREPTMVRNGTQLRTSAPDPKSRPQTTGNAVRQAQESMIRFQETLASIKTPTQ